MLNEKFKNLELKHQQDREHLLSVINEGIVQQKLNENYMQQYYEHMLGNPGMYHNLVNPNNFQNMHQDPQKNIEEKMLEKRKSKKSSVLEEENSDLEQGVEDENDERKNKKVSINPEPTILNKDIDDKISIDFILINYIH